MEREHDGVGALIDLFDRTFGSLEGLPGVVSTGQATILTTTPLVGNTETFIVQTVRHPEMGDTIFLQSLSAGRSFRLVIPPKVSAVIARQRDALVTRSRKKAARQAVETKRQRGQTIGNTAALAAARKAKRKGKAAKAAKV